MKVLETTIHFLFVFYLFSIFQISLGYTITTTQFLKDGEPNITSSGGSFQMGFFSPGNSKNRYIGIWYNNISVTTVVWVANREAPLATNSGTLKVIKPGILVIVNDTNHIIWSTNTSRSVQNPVAKLLDSGNLVVIDAGHGVKIGDFLWQSFDYPTDTLLPGMKIGWNFVTGKELYLSSWKNEEDPAPGDYTYHCDPSGYLQNILKKGSKEVYRSGPWNGLRFSGATNSRQSPFYTFGVISTKTEVYFSYHLLASVITRFCLNPNGVLQRWTWGDRNKGWALYLSLPTDNCDTYKLCGGYGSCNSLNSPVCGCLDKFEPKHVEDWGKADWSSGCVRRIELNCIKGDGFLKYKKLKLPDTRNSWFNVTMNLEECRKVCLKNCSCMAYSNLDIRNGGTGCLLWFEDLLDIRQLANEGQDIYIRMAASELASQVKSNGHKGKLLSWIIPLSAGVILVILSLVVWIRRRKIASEKKKGCWGRNGNYKMDFLNGNLSEEYELPLFGLSTIAKSTNNFSGTSKIGEGGYGPVYKGVLEHGQEIAVKRLSRTSTQGQDEFMNEVMYIVKLQHRNLVKILGCCIEGEEKMLIYEYMPNGSLDSFIFDDTRSTVLDWSKRFHVINGIARGLMYLHQDSQLRIIHRDLKANNILLDNDMNPKISDFGIARSCEDDKFGAKTHRVVGTYGYLSPEYAVHGVYSVKSDVFSFGVLVLEIVSGKGNRKFSHPNHNLNLLGHAWTLYKEGRSMELLGNFPIDVCSTPEVIRSIHVGLLCVQHRPEDRPSMSSVVMILNNEGVLPPAKQPAFFVETNTPDSEFFSSQYAHSTVNEITITTLDAR